MGKQGKKGKPLIDNSTGNANTLNGNGQLSMETSRNAIPDRYIYDPADPTPALTGGENRGLAVSGPEDVRHIEERDDVLVYTSSVLHRDVEITGSVRVVLYVSTSAPETEFIVRLLDVHPNGSSYPVYIPYSGGFNTRCLQPKEEGPNKEKILKCEFTLPPTSNVFLRGHRIRIHVCSAAFPLLRNLNTGGDFAMETKFNIAHQTVYHDEKYPSYVVFPIIPQNR